jgi:hypothetical protein
VGVRIVNRSDFLSWLKDDEERTFEACFYNWDKTPSLSCPYPLNYLKRTLHIESFHSAPIQKCDPIHERLRLRLSDEKGFDLHADDRRFASDG